MKNNTRISKGAPSGFVISLLVHAAAFLLAGMLVVFTVVNKEEKKFTPPKPVDRPKMKLKKPKVKVKKSAKPKSTSRIVTKVKRASMPDIQLPEMSGMGDSLAGGIGGFEIAPNLEEVTLLGSGQSIGNDFVGTFYDLKRTRNGNVRPAGDAFSIAEPLKKFIRSGWKPSALSSYYQSPKKLYATSFIVPGITADIAPTCFGEMETEGWGWAVHYKGKLVHKDGIKFRFWAEGDSVLIIRVNGEIVLDANYNRLNSNGNYGLAGMTSWYSPAAEDNRYRMSHLNSSVSEWITLEPGVALDMEVLLGDVKGYGVMFLICVEEDGVEYPRNSARLGGGPILPIFKTADPSRTAQDVMHHLLGENNLSTTNGPIFNDFESGGHTIDLSPTPILSELPESEVIEERMRLWTTKTGKSIEAEYTTLMGEKVILKTAKGKQVRVLLSELSAEDIEYCELSNEPKFDVSFINLSKDIPVYRSSPYTIDNANFIPPKITERIFGAKLKQTSARIYNHEIKVEYFAIGEQVNDSHKFILLDRGESRFVPTIENKRSHKFVGEPCTLQLILKDDGNQGRKYSGNMVVISDKRGKVIFKTASSKWLLDYVSALRVLPIGAYFDKEGRRVLPTNKKFKK